jgi:putative DNA primase/helicase
MLGSTTEAGLRNALKNDAFSVFFDEFEAEDRNAAARIQAILEFARPASSNEDSKIYKAKSGGGGVNSYQPRSCIGVASINVNMTQKADLSRVSVFSLVNGSKEHFDSVITPFWTENFTPEFARGIRARSISLIPVINKNADVFQRAVTAMMGSRRCGDQYGSLLACAYSLCSSNLVTIELAREFVGKQDWEGHVLTEDQSDERQCLAAILESLIMVAPGTSLSVAELLIESDITIGDCFEKSLLARHGIKYALGGFAIANKHSGVAKMLEKTPWAGNWSRILARLPMACKTDNTKFSGGQSRAVMLPITYVKG